MQPHRHALVAADPGDAACGFGAQAGELADFADQRIVDAGG